MKIERWTPTEANIQAELYWSLKNEGFVVHLEHTFILDDIKTWTGRKAKLRADVVACRENGDVVCLIEVKSRARPHPTARFKNGRQHKRYESTKIPFIYCTHMDAIPTSVSWAKSLS